MVVRDVRRGESGRYSKIGYSMAGPHAVEALRVALRSDQTKTRLSAAQTLGTMGSDAAVRRTRAHRCRTARPEQACEDRRSRKPRTDRPRASQAVEPLLELLRHEEDLQVILTVIEALGRIGPGARAAIPALAAMVKEPRHHAWNFAAVALCRIGPEGRAEASAAIPALIESLTKDQNAGVRRTAATFLAEMGPGARQAIPALTAATQDPAQEVRRAAVETLKVLNGTMVETGPGEPKAP